MSRCGGDRDLSVEPTVCITGKLEAAIDFCTFFRLGLVVLAEKFMDLTIELEQEEDGRWLAEVVDLPGVLVYGQSREDAVVRVKALALRVLADRLEHGDSAAKFDHVAFLAA